MQMRFVILSGHSLFAEGIASRLRDYPQRVDVRFIDPQQPDYVDQINAIQPAAIVIDAADTSKLRCKMLCDLLIFCSNITIVRLETQQKDIQIVTSVQHPLNDVRDLIEVVEQCSQSLDNRISPPR